MSNGPKDQFTAFDVVAGCVACPLKSRAVSVAECHRCERGFLVCWDGQDRYALCPSDRTVALVGDVMSPRVIAARPDLPIENLILLLVDEGINAVPVVDADHRPIGMASRSDLVFDRYEWAELRDEAVFFRRVGRKPGAPEPEDDLQLAELLRSKTVSDVMSTEPLSVTADTRVVDAARLMTTHQLHGCPVVDAAGRVIAMFTTFDVARWAAAGA